MPSDKPPLRQLVAARGTEPPNWRGSLYTRDAYLLSAPGLCSPLPKWRRTLHVEELVRRAADFPAHLWLEHVAIFGASVGFDNHNREQVGVPDGASCRRNAAWFGRQCARMRADRIAVPCPHPVKVSPQHVVPKPGSQARPDAKRARIITDASAGGSRSLNSGIEMTPPWPAIRLTRVADFRDALARHIRAGTMPWIFKVDVDDAYHRVPVRQQDWPLLAFRGPQGTYLCYTALAFGVRSSSFNFCPFTDAVVWALRLAGDEVFPYIDDISGIGVSYDDAMDGLHRTTYLLNTSGLPVSTRKLEAEGSPAPVKEILGVTFNCTTNSAYISRPRRRKLAAQLRRATTRHRLGAKEVSEIAGRMAWFSQIHSPARPFAASWWAAAAAAHGDTTAEAGPRRARSVPVSRAMRRDARWFLVACQRRHAVPIAPPPVSAHLYTDASLRGYGAAVEGEHIIGTWSKRDTEMAASNIYLLEFVCVVIALRALGDSLRNRRILLHTDNEAVEHAIRGGHARHPVAKLLLRELVATVLALGAEMEVTGVRSAANKVADALSRSICPPVFSFPHDPTTTHIPAPRPQPTTSELRWACWGTRWSCSPGGGRRGTGPARRRPCGDGSTGATRAGDLTSSGRETTKKRSSNSRTSSPTSSRRAWRAQRSRTTCTK